MKEIHFDCPACGQPIFTDLSTAIKSVACPACAHVFNPRSLPVPEPEGSVPDSETTKEVLEEQARQRAEKIHGQANSLSLIAGCCTSFGIMILLACMGLVFTGTSCFLGWIVASSLIGTGFWLYLVAQIIHIRANTER